MTLIRVVCTFDFCILFTEDREVGHPTLLFETIRQAILMYLFDRLGNRVVVGIQNTQFDSWQRRTFM